MEREKENRKAAFEAGIKLGALFHQFIGVPVSEKNVRILELAIESCVILQPYVVEVCVEINREKVREASKSKMGYTSLSPDMLKAKVVVEINDARAEAILEWDEELQYPMMRLVE